jgi:anaerobic selenocysteine-containing dehydrogenase
MAMYHSWDSQNAWLRQIHSLQLPVRESEDGDRAGFADGDWIWVESHHGKVKCMCAVLRGR